MRDPLESKPRFLPAVFITPPDKKTSDQEMEIALTEAHTRLNQLRRCSKILSLTIDAPGYEGNAEIFGRGYARARMWEQYSEQHRGVCLMLRRNAFRTTAIAQLTSRSPDSWAAAVSYTQMGTVDDEAEPLMIVDDEAAPLMPSQGPECRGCDLGPPAHTLGCDLLCEAP
jgi:hypothetical protein